MIDSLTASLAVLLALGAVHGLNPAMGWLFSVALGMQEESGRAVWRSLGPLALGHALAVAVALAAAAILGRVLDLGVLRWIVAGALLGVGLLHLRRHRHPRWVGMRVGLSQLTLWSFLMASAHGAGLMAVPFLPQPANGSAVAVAHGTESPTPAHRHHHAPTSMAGAGSSGSALLATLVHTLGYLAATGGIAALVYYRLGLGVLRRAWLNVDLLWALALIGTALLIPLT